MIRFAFIDRALAVLEGNPAKCCSFNVKTSNSSLRLLFTMRTGELSCSQWSGNCRDFQFFSDAFVYNAYFRTFTLVLSRRTTSVGIFQLWITFSTCSNLHHFPIWIFSPEPALLLCYCLGWRLREKILTRQTRVGLALLSVVDVVRTVCLFHKILVKIEKV